MDKPKKPGVPRRIFSGIFALLLSLFVIGLIYIAVTLLHSPEIQSQNKAPAETQSPVTPLQPGATGDAGELEALFGAPLPILPGHSFSGSAENAVHDGTAARKATLQYEGFRVSAVQPASAAALLLYPALDVSLRSDLNLLNCPALLATKGSAWCVYFSTPQTAYAVYAPQADEESFLELLGRLRWSSD